MVQDQQKKAIQGIKLNRGPVAQDQLNFVWTPENFEYFMCKVGFKATRIFTGLLKCLFQRA